MNVFYAIWPWNYMGNRGEMGEMGLKCTETETSMGEVLPIISVKKKSILEVCTAVSKNTVLFS